MDRGLRAAAVYYHHLSCGHQLWGRRSPETSFVVARVSGRLLMPSMVVRSTPQMRTSSSRICGVSGIYRMAVLPVIDHPDMIQQGVGQETHMTADLEVGATCLRISS